LTETGYAGLKLNIPLTVCDEAVVEEAVALTTLVVLASAVEVEVNEFVETVEAVEVVGLDSQLEEYVEVLVLEKLVVLVAF
jgi:hypothetical protein